MKTNLTIAYMTSRKNPQINWFFDSLHRETGGDYTGIKVVVVDFWAKQRNEPDHNTSALKNAAMVIPNRGGAFAHVEPKPTVWQGTARLTKADYFAAANARNTALCLAPDGWIALVDDVSVLMPGWLNAVREAMEGNYVVCGSYRKVLELTVDNGNVLGFKDCPNGHDTRWPAGDDTKAVDCAKTPEWTYGCSFAAPVEALLNIGGVPEVCNGIGYEDCVTGFMLANNGYAPATGIRYDRRMMTIESEELHGQLPRFLREDPCRGDPNANPRDDMSHALLRILKPKTYHPGYFGDEGIRGLRQRVLNGEPFPPCGIPLHRWFDGVLLCDLPNGVAPNVPLPYYDKEEAT